MYLLFFRSFFLGRLLLFGVSAAADPSSAKQADECRWGGAFSAMLVKNGDTDFLSYLPVKRSSSCEERIPPKRGLLLFYKRDYFPTSADEDIASQLGLFDSATFSLDPVPWQAAAGLRFTGSRGCFPEPCRVSSNPHRGDFVSCGF